MFRTAFRAPKKTLLTATVAGTTVTLVGTNGVPDPSQLSIYPSPTPDILLVNAPSELEKQIGVARRHVSATYNDAYAHVQGWVSKWIGVEHAVEKRVKSIISPAETASLTPSLLYVGISTLTGSILARNRGLPTRIFLPPLFLILSSQYFLPQTTSNLSEYLGSLEDAHFPVVAEKHEVAKAHTKMSWEMLKEKTKNGREAVNKGSRTAVEKVQEVTGLKLRETLGWKEEAAKRVLEEARKEVAEVKTEVEKKVKDVEKSS